jgi:hypothetical protein
MYVTIGIRVVRLSRLSAGLDGSPSTRLLGLWVRIPLGAWISVFVSCLLCVVR